MSYQEELSHLSPIETFDPAAFKGDAGTPQGVCDFVLALALSYNDLRDLTSAQNILLDHKPAIGKPSPPLGLFAGLRVALMRAQFGVLHEILQLVEAQAVARADASFARLVKQLTP